MYRNDASSFLPMWAIEPRSDGGGNDLETASEEERADASIVLAAVKNHWSAILHAAPELKADQRSCSRL
jgi:hypothetical protein